MSFENVPKNLTDKAVLVRQGKPDYTKLASVSFPTPTADEAGAILENSDTGTRYRWTGTTWILSLRDSSDFFFEVSKGNIAGHANVNIVMRNPLATSPFEDLWGVGGNMVPVSQAGETWEIVSADANDTAAGTGAREVTIISLDANYNTQITTVATNGGTVVLPGTHYATQDMAISDAGTSMTNAGDITLQISGGGNKRNIILAGFSESQSCHFTIPAGKTGYAIYIQAIFPKGGDGIVRTITRSFSPRITSIRSNFPFYQSSDIVNIKSPPPIVEKTDIILQADASATGAEVNALVHLILVDNIL